MKSRKRLLFIWIGFAIPMIAAGEVGGRMIGVEYVGMIVIFVLIALLALSVYLYSDRIMLRWYHAEEVRNDAGSPLHEIIERLSKEIGIPPPRVYIVDSPMPNAFAVGKNRTHGSIAVTSGLIELLDRGEISAVLAHELAHIDEGETRVACEVGVVAGSLTALATVAFWAAIFTGFGQEDDPAPNLIRFFVTALVAPVAATIVQFVVYGSREYTADERGVSILGRGDELASALERIENKLKRDDGWSSGVNPSHAHLFTIDPFHHHEFTLMDISLPTYHPLFRTQPETLKRVRRLKGADLDDEPMGPSAESLRKRLIKPFFFSSIAYLSLLFVIIVIDTFSRKDFVFARALLISALYLGALSISFLIMSAVFRAKLKPW